MSRRRAGSRWQHGKRCARERGVVLFVALIALVALTLAGLAIMRSVDTGGLISGNMAFHQAALHRADIGVEAAFIGLPNVLATSKDANIANQYFAVRQPVDGNGVPTTAVWANVPCRTNTNAVVACSTQDYQVRYVIDRMCEVQTSGSTAVTNIQSYCYADIGNGKGGAQGSFGAVFTGADAVYYRVTVQVSGPHNASAYVQTLISTN